MTSNVITNRSILLIINYAHEVYESIRLDAERSSTVIRFIPRPQDLHLIRSEMSHFHACLRSGPGAFEWNIYTGADQALERDFSDATIEEIVLIPTSFRAFPRIRAIFVRIAQMAFGAIPGSRESNSIVQDLADSIEGDDFLTARTTYTVRNLLEMLFECEYMRDRLTEESLDELERVDRELMDTVID